MQTYAVLYSYPTSDPYYRGQRGTRVLARDEDHALEQIQRGVNGCDPVPDAQIVRCEISRKVAPVDAPQTIRVSAETWRRLQAFATPFRGSDLGTPDKVIAHLLDAVDGQEV